MTNYKIQCDANPSAITLSTLNTTKVLTFATCLHLFLIALEYDVDLDNSSFKNIGIVSLSFSCFSGASLLILWILLIVFSKQKKK
mmetsp:Transcript_18756/g.26241  ORF Transcript_18756/g.26241 Transcript_18756/m.26241 type:complete len:85 (+) Transcript_18756:51-305(+)